LALLIAFARALGQWLASPTRKFSADDFPERPVPYMEKTHFRGTGCGAPDAVADKLCRSYFLAMEARNNAKMKPAGSRATCIEHGLEGETVAPPNPSSA
jgi:hypothetical protein